jgi:hypothetical protein
VRQGQEVQEVLPAEAITVSLTTTAALAIVPGLATYTEAQLQQAVNAADAAIKHYCKRAVLEEQTIATLYLSGNGIEDLVLPHYPVTSIGAIYLDSNGYFGKRAGAFPASSQILEGTDWVIVQDGDGTGPASKSGLLRRIAGGSSSTFDSSSFWGSWGRGRLTARQAPFWNRGYGNVKIVNLKAGFNPVPADLVQACNQLAAWMLKFTATGGRVLSSESLASYSYGLSALQSRPELGETRSLLARYQQASVGTGI